MTRYPPRRIEAVILTCGMFLAGCASDGGSAPSSLSAPPRPSPDPPSAPEATAPQTKAGDPAGRSEGRAMKFVPTAIPEVVRVEPDETVTCTFVNEMPGLKITESYAAIDVKNLPAEVPGGI